MKLVYVILTIFWFHLISLLEQQNRKIHELRFDLPRIFSLKLTMRDNSPCVSMFLVFFCQILPDTGHHKKNKESFSLE